MTTATDEIDTLKQHRRRALSVRRRAAYAALLATHAGVLAGLVSLWATEPSLPLRTHGAFGGLTSLASAWVVLLLWVLTRRRPLNASDRVLVARLASRWWCWPRSCCAGRVGCC